WMPAAKRIAIKIDELDCAEEMLLLRREFNSIPGILALDFNVVQGRMDVVHDEQQIDIAEILQRIERLGMHGHPWQRQATSNSAIPEAMLRQRLMIASGAFLLAGLLIHAFQTGSFLAPWIPAPIDVRRAYVIGLPQLAYLLAILAGIAPIV